MNNDIIIHWFRQDLRIIDNPSLSAASEQGTVLPIYIMDNANASDYRLGSASRWWLHHSLNSLNKSLQGKLAIYIGNPEVIINDLIEKYDVKAVFWNRCYEPWQVARDKKIKDVLEKSNTKAKSFNGSLLWEPWQVLKKDGTPYKVFTPFYRNGCMKAPAPRIPIPEPSKLIIHEDPDNIFSIDELKLLPTIKWDKKLESLWKIGEIAATKKLEKFISNRLENYKKGRDFPVLNSVSRLSPHLHFGEISPNQVWYAAKNNETNDDLEHFLSELGWREFSHSLLFYFPELPKENMQDKFNDFPWLENLEHLRCWQKGQTGFPLVDAGMRELWETGYMHNRVRMLVGSFLVKNLLLHWHHGKEWFWDCLLDADLANNSASWQWIAGCGADAAPYFRIFNPSTQGEKFDPHGEYTKRFVPELKMLPDKYLHKPWVTPTEVLLEAGVELGKTYPEPIVDIRTSRLRALDAYHSIKTS